MAASDISNLHLGNLYAAQLMDKAKQDLGDLDADFRLGKFVRLKGWLNEKVHRKGQQYRPRDLAQRITGQPLSPTPLVTYLRTKYGELLWYFVRLGPELSFRVRRFLRTRNDESRRQVISRAGPLLKAE